MLAPNTLLQDRYLVVKTLGKGGMGAVYLATDTRFELRVAVKQAFFGPDADPSEERAFRHEARLLRTLRHPALPSVGDLFKEGESWFLVMDFVEGHDLGGRLDTERGALSVKEVLGWADQLLDVLDYLHSHEPPIIHRDIKPQNIKVTPAGKVLLLDFGLAKGATPEMGLGHGKTILHGGTKCYSSPEQRTFAPTDARSDLYSLAATLYVLLTYRNPTDALERATAKAGGSPDGLQPADAINHAVPEELSRVLHRAMSLDPNHRPSSATRMRTMLQSVAAAMEVAREGGRAEPGRGDTQFVGTPRVAPAAIAYAVREPSDYPDVPIDRERMKALAREIADRLPMPALPHSRRALGIDLNASQCTAAWFVADAPSGRNVKPQRVTHDSIVAFSKSGEPIVGSAARQLVATDVRNCFPGVGRLLGRAYSEASYSARHGVFPLRKGEGDRIVLPCPNLNRRTFPEEISAYLLRRLVIDASLAAGEFFDRVVISAQTEGDPFVRGAIQDVANLAGVESYRILPSTTAVSMLAGTNAELAAAGDVGMALVVDLGATGLTVGVAEIGEGVVEIKTHMHASGVGTLAIDQVVAEELLRGFEGAESSSSLAFDYVVWRRLLDAARQARVELTSAPETLIAIPALTADGSGPRHLERILGRVRFDAIVGAIVAKIRSELERAFAAARFSPDDAGVVLLCGDASRMPGLKSLVRELSASPVRELPANAVAYGAAIQAAVLTGDIRDVLCMDIYPHSLGIETRGGFVDLIESNTTIPTRKSEVFVTSSDDQTSVEVRVAQGGGAVTPRSRSLGKLRLSGIPPAPRGVPCIEVTIDVDGNSAVGVMAKELSLGREAKYAIPSSYTDILRADQSVADSRSLLDVQATVPTQHPSAKD